MKPKEQDQKRLQLPKGLLYVAERLDKDGNPLKERRFYDVQVSKEDAMISANANHKATGFPCRILMLATVGVMTKQTPEEKPPSISVHEVTCLNCGATTDGRESLCRRCGMNRRGKNR